MAIVVGDYETYYSTEYSLSRMSEVEYILDPRFQAIMLTLNIDDQPTETYIGETEIRRRLDSLDWSKIYWISHNVRFDGSILAWRYNKHPRMYGCTLSMARAVTHAVVGKSSLAAVSAYLGLPPKGDEVVRALGKRLEDFSAPELRDYAAYCRRDTENCRAIFDRLRPIFSASEIVLIDLVARMFIEPQVYLDPHVLAEHLHEVRALKEAALQGIPDPSVLSSNQKFAELLESMGVEVPMKLSPATGKYIPALARNDREFKELCDDPETPLAVQALLAARKQAKSTLEETRTETLLKLSLRSWPDGVTGRGPVPLKYAGAHTHRLSGDGGTNWQNFKRGSKIRQGIRVPEGYRIVHKDAKQIEARMVAWLAGCQKLLKAFAEGRDVYSEFATLAYRRTITPSDKGERFVGKTCVLGLGYGTGPPKLRHTLFIGNGGMSIKIDEKEATRLVYLYRDTYKEIPNLWSYCDLALQGVAQHAGRTGPNSGFWRPHRDRETIGRIGPVRAGYDCLWLPNGLCIAYPNLRVDRGPDGTHGYYYDGPRKEMKKIYGAKVVENVSQALSRIIVTDIAVRVYHETGYRPWLSTHDSLDYCVPASEALGMSTLLETEFARQPSWAPDIPLASEGGWGRTLAIAEDDKHPEHNR